MEQLSDNVFPSWWFDGYAGECEQEKVNCYCCDEKCDEDEIDTAYIYKEGLPHTVANTTSVKICKDCANSILSKATVDDVIACIRMHKKQRLKGEEKMQADEMKFKGEVADPRGRMMKVYLVGRPSLEWLKEYQIRSFLNLVYKEKEKHYDNLICEASQ